MTGGAAREELEELIQVLVDDADLRAWFEGMDALPPATRSAEFQRMAAAMTTAGEHPELIVATSLLAKTEVYRAVRATVSDLLESS